MSFLSQCDQPTCKNRMSYIHDKEKIYMLEDCDDYCKSQIKEAPVNPYAINIYQDRIIVECFDYMNGTEEKEYFINDLKQFFHFVKIINLNNKEQREINFLIFKNKPKSSMNLINNEENEILEKINNKACLGNKIKNILNIDEFPLENYFLEKLEGKSNFYDKIFALKKNNSYENGNSQNSNINFNNINNPYNNSNFNNVINNNIINSNNNNNFDNNNNNELIKKMDNIENRINGIEKKLDEILRYVKK